MKQDNMVEMANDVSPDLRKKFISAIHWIEADWITIRITLRNPTTIRVHAIRTDGKEEYMHFKVTQINQMSVSRILNLLRQLVHND